MHYLPMVENICIFYPLSIIFFFPNLLFGHFFSKGQTENKQPWHHRLGAVWVVTAVSWFLTVLKTVRDYKKQCCGSTSFWSGSADPLPGKLDPDPTPAKWSGFGWNWIPFFFCIKYYTQLFFLSNLWPCFSCVLNKKGIFFSTKGRGNRWIWIRSTDKKGCIN